MKDKRLTLMSVQTQLNQIIDTLADMNEVIGKRFDTVDVRFDRVENHLDHIEKVIIREHGGRLEVLEQKTGIAR